MLPLVVVVEVGIMGLMEDEDDPTWFIRGLPFCA